MTSVTWDRRVPVEAAITAQIKMNCFDIDMVDRWRQKQ